MASTGVGRGRGYLARDKARQEASAQQQSLRGLISPAGETEWKSTLELLAMKVAALDINNQTQLDEIKDEMLSYCQTSDRMKILMDDVHERSLNDSKFGIRAAVTISAISQLVVDNVKLRAVLIKNLQTDFTNADTLRAGRKMRYLNAIGFLGEVYNSVRLADGVPIHVLAAAHLAYQRSLLAGDESELELCVNLLALNGRKLLAYEPDVLNRLMLTVNETLIVHPDLRSRAWLLLAVQLHTIKYDPHKFPADSREMFARQLGPDTTAAVMKQLTMSPDFPDEVNGDGASDRSSVGTLASAPDIGMPRDGGGDQRAANVSRPAATPPRTETAPRRQEPSPADGGNNWRDKPPSEDSRSSVFRRLGTRGEPPGAAESADADDGAPRNRGSGRRNDPRDNPDTWLPVPTRTEADVKAWGLNPSRGSHWGHDDRCDGDYPRGGEGTTRARDWKPSGRYGSGRIPKDAMDKPLPDGDAAWD